MVLYSKEQVLAAVAQDGFALGYASAELRADREVVLAAVAQSGSALEHASEALKADKEVVLAAVAQSAPPPTFAPCACSYYSSPASMTPKTAAITKASTAAMLLGKPKSLPPT